MIVHIVMFKFKEENRYPNIIEVKKLLEELIEFIPSLKTIDVGVNFSKEDRALDMSLITTFENQEGLDEYANHPEHLRVLKFIKEVVDYTKVVDYER